jgi:hypothetical protein
MAQDGLEDMVGVDIPSRSRRRPINLKPGDKVLVDVDSRHIYTRTCSFRDEPAQPIEFICLGIRQNGEDCVIAARHDSCFGRDLETAFPKLGR